MNKYGRTLLNQTLDLFSSYLFGQTVELDAVSVGVSSDQEFDETTRFLNELEGRHAIACGLRLKEIINLIERSVSSISVLTSSESKGAIKGRLNIPKYLSRRTKHTSLPRTYPILINEELPNTPENALASYALRGLMQQLGRSPFPRSYAEGLASSNLYSWGRSRLKRLPWVEVQRLASIPRLQRESLQRIRKRQTGNDFAYQSLVEWTYEWQINAALLGDNQRLQVLEGLLAFPIGDFFWEKVFEVWCLKEVAKALEACGCEEIEKCQPLHKRGALPIYTFKYRDRVLEIWFQKQLSPEKADWNYINGNSLRGIPDITIHTKDFSPLILDAKLRIVKTNTRSEEVYKLLGYAENFKKVFEKKPFYGVLIFVGEELNTNILVGPNNGEISMVVVNPESPEGFGSALKSVCLKWLNHL